MRLGKAYSEGGEFSIREPGRRRQEVVRAKNSFVVASRDKLGFPGTRNTKPQTGGIADARKRARLLADGAHAAHVSQKVSSTRSTISIKGGTLAWNEVSACACFLLRVRRN